MRKTKLLLMACAILSASQAWAYQTPAADGIYYLYNTACTQGTPGFLSSGNNYGFQAVIDQFGLPVKLISTGADNTYLFQFIHHNGFLSDNGFMYSDGDTERARTITVQDQGEGNYKLINTNNENTDIEDWYGNIVGDGTGNRRNYIWQFLSKEERDAIIAGYTTDVKLNAATSMGITLSELTAAAFDDYLSANYIEVDQSSKIQNGTFNTIHNTTGWTTVANSNSNFNIGWGNLEPKTTPEVYEGAGAIRQTITVDKAGLYKVSVNATYRCGNSANNNRIGELGYDGSVAYLKANNSIAKIPDWYSGKINGNGPDSPSEANSTYFLAGKYLTEVLVYVGEEKEIEISINSPAHTWGGWLMFNNFKLIYYSDEVSDEDATEILKEANSYEGKKMQTAVQTALTNAKNTFEGAKTIANYNALSAANTIASASIAEYAKLNAAITAASTIYSPLAANIADYNNAINDAQAIYDAATTSDCSDAIKSLENAMKTANIADFNYVDTNFPYGVTLGTWTTVNAIDRSGQHWDGTSTSTYSEQNEGWGDNHWTCSYSQKLTLPAGKYVFKVAGRKSSDYATIELTVKNGDNIISSVNSFPNGDTGFGISTDGKANFSTEGTYANNNIGRGWQWRFAEFELTDPATVNVAITATATAQNQWVGFCNATIQTNNNDNIALMEALITLNSTKTQATLTKYTNTGSGIFQYDEYTNNSLWSAYEAAKENADNYTLTASSTANEINSLVTALNDAITNYNNQSLNAPVTDSRYFVSIVEDGKDWNGNAITFIAGARTDMGLYGIKYLAPANANMNQALKFTAVEGELNTYKVSAIRPDGSEQYITTGSTYEGGNNNQIRTTDDAAKASWIKISATPANGKFQLLNVSAGNKVIANNGNNDVYTNGNADFTIAEATQATVNLAIDADVKYATRIFPFTPTLPAGVKAYSCEALDGTTLTLTEVATLAANVPYILEATEGCASTDLNGWGTADAESYTEGLLTGVYAATPAPVGSYVMQNGTSGVGFYQVAENGQPTVGANRVYLTATSQARTLFFSGETTAIYAINALTSGKAEIYDTAGTRLPTLKKGIHIIKNGDKTMKVMVK